jgi:hypothetical protein
MWWQLKICCGSHATHLGTWLEASPGAHRGVEGGRFKKLSQSWFESLNSSQSSSPLLLQEGNEE